MKQIKYFFTFLNQFKNKGIWLFLIVCIFNDLSFAQEKISLNSAIDSALKNNSSLNLEKLKIHLAEKQIETYKNLPKTNIGSEIGQFNTNLIDTKFNISQNFSLPVVYKKQKLLLESYYNASKTERELKIFEIKKNLYLIYNSLGFLNAKKNLLTQIDSVYINYEKISNLRYIKGETNLLDKTLGEQQRQNIEMQAMSINEEINNQKFVFNSILNNITKFEPYLDNNYSLLSSPNSEYSLENHPLLLNLQELEKIEKSKSELTLALQKPELSAGINNTSFSGPAPNVASKTYTNLNRFSSVQFGVAIPLNGNHYKKVNEASKLAIKVAENDLAMQEKQLSQNLMKLKENYSLKLKSKLYFETYRLPNVKLIAELAEKRFSNGEISYAELSAYLYTVFNTQSEYIDCINALNLLDIDIRFLN